MKEQPDHIDQVFRQRLQHAAVPPPEFVWPNVEAALRQRRRRFLFWFWGTGLAVAALALGLWALHQNGHAKTPAPPVASTTAPTLAPLAPTLAPNRPAAPVMTPAPAEPAALETAVAAAPAIPSQYAAAASGSPVRPAHRPGRKAATKAPGKTVEVVEPRTEAAVVEEGVSLEKQPVAAVANPVSSPAANLPGTNRPLENRLLSTLPTLSLLSNKTPHQPEFLTVKAYHRKKKGPKKCYDFAGHPLVWLADAYAGPAWTKKTLLTTGSDPNTAYRQQRLDTERSDWAYSAGVRGSIMVGQFFLLRSGLHYTQMTEVFEYADPDYVRTIYEQDLHTGHIDTIIEYGEHYVKTYNRFGLLDIPLQAGVELRQGRTGLSFNAGVSFNLLFWKRGTVLTPAGDPAPFTPDAKDAVPVFRNSVGLSAMGSVQWFWHIQPRLRLFVEPYFRQVLQPVTLASHPLQQGYGFGGVNIGVTQILK